MTLHSSATSDENAIELRPRSIGEIVGLTFALYRRNFPLFIGIAAMVIVPTLIVLAISQLMSLAAIAADPAAFFSVGTSEAPTGNASLLLFGSSCVNVFAAIGGIFWPWMEGALTHNVIERVLGKTPGLRESYRDMRSRFGALWTSNALVQLAVGAVLLVLLVLVAIAVGVGGAGAVIATIMAVMCSPVVLVGAFIVFMLTLTWTFRAPVIAGEGVDGIASLGRSNDLVKGHRWQLFGRYALFGFLTSLVVEIPLLVLIGIVVVVATSAMDTSSGTATSATVVQTILPTLTGVSVISIGITFVATLLLTPLAVIFNTLNYLDVRTRNENLAAAILNAPQAATAAPAAIATTPVVPVPVPLPVLVTAASAPVAAPITSQPPLSPDDIQKLPPGQRIGALFNQLRIEGESAHVLNNLGMAYMEIGDLGGALDALTRARAVAPGDADIAFNLVRVYRDRNDMRQAKQMMADYLRLETNPDDLAAVRNNPRYKDLIDQ